MLTKETVSQDKQNKITYFNSIRKRDGRIVKFDAEKITNAIAKAGAATDEFDQRVAQSLTLKVLNLAHQAITHKTPTVEEIQDVVEEILLSSPYRKTAKAYIIHRDQHAKIREITAKAEVDLIDQYLGKIDWQVNENSNMTFSLQGLNNYVSSDISRVYWLNKLYPPEIKEAYLAGDFHIHDLNILSVYCVGWDLFDLLREGFKGVSGKMESNPAKHFRSALGQVVNFFYTLQGEAAGAQAFSNFDTLLAPFIRYDRLSYKEVKQALQEFIFNVNVPTRVGFQCVSEDTEILTLGGWKGYKEVKRADIIKTFNINTGRIENQKVASVFKRFYRGTMYNLKNRIQDQLISPRHRVVRRKFQTNRYVLEPIEEIARLKSPFVVPVAGKNTNKEAKIDDRQIKLMAWIIGEGSIERPTKHRCCYRITLYQSEKKNKKNYKEIISLLKYFNLKYSVSEHASLGAEVKRIRLNAESSRKIHRWFGTRERVKFIPDILLDLSERQSKVFLETYLKAEGFEGCKIATTDLEILDSLQIIAVNAGYGFTVLKRKPTIGTKDIYVLRLIKHKETYIQKIVKIDYKGIIWCPHTKNETLIARRNGKVFITGNTPFTNITLDLTCPSHYADSGVIIGGKLQRETYKDFKEEMDIFNKALFEVMIEGDAKDRVFTFPIPTYNIAKDFNWENHNLKGLWEITAKYGVPYFSNFVNSDMKPEDARSMCLHPDEELVVRKKEGITKTSIGELVEGQVKEFDSNGWSDAKGTIDALSLNPESYQIEWVKIKRFLKVKDDILITVRTVDGKEMRLSQNHLVAVYTSNRIEAKLAKNLEKNDILLTTRKAQDIFKQNHQRIGTKKLDEKLGYLVGFFVADGNYLYDSRYEQKRTRGIQFSFNTTGQQQSVIKKLVQDIYDYELKFIQDPRYGNSLRGYLYQTDTAKEWIIAGIEKYNNIAKIIFDSPLSVIQAFLNGFFSGDGYEKGKEIHMNDEGLAKDLVILMTLAGVNCTYRKRKNSQVVRIQHTLGRGAKHTNVVVDTSYNRVPQFLVKTSSDKPFYNKNVMPCKSSLDRRSAHTEESIKILNSDLALVKVESIKMEHLPYKQDFYDIELEKNHYFVHSLGNITHNCCRLRIDNRTLEKRGGGLFGSHPLTGSIGVVTVNMPRLGFLSKDENEFIERLERIMILAKESLEMKRKILEKFTEGDLYPYVKFYLRDIKKRFNEYWKNHFSTIGLIGMNEACLNLFGENLGSNNARDFTLRILDFMRNKLIEFQQETKNNYNLEATPAEGTSYRLAKKDKEKYPQIICANEEEYKKGAKPFYTNSTQLPVNFTNDVFEALDLQDGIQIKYSGGCVEKGNKVLTDKGLLPIEDIIDNFRNLRPIKALSHNKELKISEWDEIIEAVTVDVKNHNKIRIKGERNLDITTSDWHPFFVLERIKINPACPICEEKVGNTKGFATHLRWSPECRVQYKTMPKYRVAEKRADELKIGDYILQNHYSLYPEKETELNNDLMWLVGFFIGDGCISEFIDNRGGNNLKRYKIRFNSSSKPALTRASRILSKYFQTKTQVIQNDKRSAVLREVATSKKEALDFFFRYGFKTGKKVYNICIPRKIKENLNKNNVFSLLSGLMDSDGHIHKRNGSFEYCTVSFQLADDILEICSRAGIMISKSLKLTKRENEVNIYRLRIPQYELSKMYDNLNNVVNILNIKKSLSNRKKRHLPVVRVKEVSKVDVKDNQFYDLMTKENHNYLAGKDCLVFVHNTVLHIFAGERIENLDAVRALVRKTCENYHLPYFTFTPTFSICPTHGYLNGEVNTCPKCGAECEIYSRVVGYLRPVKQWNEGKKSEFKLRKTFKL